MLGIFRAHFFFTLFIHYFTLLQTLSFMHTHPHQSLILPRAHKNPPFCPRAQDQCTEPVCSGSGEYIVHNKNTICRLTPACATQVTPGNLLLPVCQRSSPPPLINLHHIPYVPLTIPPPTRAMFIPTPMPAPRASDVPLDAPARSNGPPATTHPLHGVDMAHLPSPNTIPFPPSLPAHMHLPSPGLPMCPTPLPYPSAGTLI